MFQITGNFYDAMNDMSRTKKSEPLKDEIEANLKRVYDEVASEEVPARFTDLLSQLRAAEQGSQDAQKGGEGSDE